MFLFTFEQLQLQGYPLSQSMKSCNQNVNTDSKFSSTKMHCDYELWAFKMDYYIMDYFKENKRCLSIATFSFFNLFTVVTLFNKQVKLIVYLFHTIHYYMYSLGESNNKVNLLKAIRLKTCNSI